MLPYQYVWKQSTLAGYKMQSFTTSQMPLRLLMGLFHLQKSSMKMAAPTAVSSLGNLAWLACNRWLYPDWNCQNESDVTRRMSVEIWQHSVLVRLQSCPQIYQEQRDKRFYMFVAKCLAVIHDVLEPSQYNFVPTSINLADDASRRLTVKELLKREVWFRGPKFLWESETS